MQQTHPAKPPATRTAQRAELVFFFLVAAAIIYATWRVFSPYITPILLAIIITTFTHRFYRRMTTAFRGRRQLAAITMSLIDMLVIVVPLTILVLLLIQQARALVDSMQHTDIGEIVRFLRIEDLQSWAESTIPGLSLENVDFGQSIASLVRNIPALVVTQGGNIVAGVTELLLGFFLMLFTIYFLYIEGERLVQEMKYLSPLPDMYDEEIFGKFRDIISATFKGQFLTALAQGVVTGVGFAIAGLPAPIFWGAVASVLSLLPAVGAAAVWAPAALYLYISASVQDTPMWPAIFLTVWGLTIVSLTDNFLRPYLMRGNSDMPTIVLFFSILGGIQAFGFLGVLLGPLVVALFVTILHIYKRVFRKALNAQNIVPEVGSASATPADPARR